MKNNKYSFSSFLFLLGALSCLILLVLRIAQVISFQEVHHVVTSGFEEESLYAMWKFLHGLPLYTDPHQIPFTASYFNWFFYTIYGSITKFVMSTFSLEDAWIPTVGRCITLGVVLIGFLVNFRLFAHKDPDAVPTPTWLAISLSALLWFGPLIGYWALTVRPDVVALLFDVCAAYFLLRYFPKQLFFGVILAAFWCYLSWSCKQVNIVMPVAIGLFLLLHKRWQAFILFSMLMGAGFATTLLLADYNLIKTLLFINTAVPLSFEVFTVNLINFIKKTIPVWILFFAILGTAATNSQARQKILHDKLVKFSLCGLFAWALILLPASSKIGSADNYHFIALFFLIVAIGASLPYLLVANSKLLTASIGLAGVLSTTAIIVVLANGSLATIQAQHANNVAFKQCLHHFPQPIFVMNSYGALPWMNPSPISFVLAYNYWQDRSDNRPFEHNGIGGLIQQGYFQTLILPSTYSTSFDGATLSNYEYQTKDCAGYSVFIHKEKA